MQPRRLGMRQQSEPVAPMPRHARDIAPVRCRRQLAVAGAPERTSCRCQERRSHPRPDAPGRTKIQLIWDCSRPSARSGGGGSTAMRSLAYQERTLPFIRVTRSAPSNLLSSSASTATTQAGPTSGPSPPSRVDNSQSRTAHSRQRLPSIPKGGASRKAAARTSGNFSQSLAANGLIDATSRSSTRGHSSGGRSSRKKLWLRHRGLIRS